MKARDIAILIMTAIGVTAITSSAAASAEHPTAFRLRLDTGHPWRPPFALARVGQPITAVVESGKRPQAGRYILEAIARGKLVSRQSVRFSETPPYSARLPLDAAVFIDELVLLAKTNETAPPVEMSKQVVHVPEFEADAVAQPDNIVNPVDLGTILVPSGWLLLSTGQGGTIEITAISRTRELPNAVAKAYFDSAPARVVTGPFALHAAEKSQISMKLPDAPLVGDRDVLTVVVEDGAGRELWRKAIPVMFVRADRRPPRFGATYERLRYDSPISVRDPQTGHFSSMRYEDGWKPEFRDVVVWLPNGGRFVFWRGSSYIPFWAGLHNTGACYEWAEIISQPQGAVDCVEPLMDKELRYSRVEIVESTTARVHVRWTYQSTDLHYRVWGDEAVEDYYFYPDGFGTRVVSLKADPKNDYELSEFIILTPQGAYPFEVLPDDPVDALYLSGRKRRFRFPNPVAPDMANEKREGDQVPAIYRLRFGKLEKLSAVYFSPNLVQAPAVVFAPFFDLGQMVTPCYWGSHWPLARGNSTGRAIDDRIKLSPTHNSVMSWANRRPEPLTTTQGMMLDSMGRSRLMTIRRWAWLLGLSDANDERLLDWAKSFSAPPSVDLRGARIGFSGYVAERRAISLFVMSKEVQVAIKPSGRCVNPVFELEGAPDGAARVMLAGRELDPERYAWDGRTLWLDATIEEPTELRMIFSGPPARSR